MNDEKNTIPVNKITHKNTPNDDEKRMKRCEKLQGSESTGIP